MQQQAAHRWATQHCEPATPKTINVHVQHWKDTARKRLYHTQHHALEAASSSTSVASISCSQGSGPGGTPDLELFGQLSAGGGGSKSTRSSSVRFAVSFPFLPFATPASLILMSLSACSGASFSSLSYLIGHIQDTRRARCFTRTSGHKTHRACTETSPQ